MLLSMTRLAVAIMVGSVEQALAAAARAAEQGADLVEFRIDRFTDSPDQITRLVERSSLSCIVTCRPTAEGGAYDGDEMTRIALLEHAALGTHPPAYLDLELSAYQRSANLRQKIDLVVDHPGQVKPTTTGLILSSHDFFGRPVDLYQQIEAMAAAPACRVVKVAWKARSLRDNLEALEIISHRHKPTIALCMGDFGLPSRVLARKFGAFLTYAAPDQSSGTALGQPTLAEFKRLYRWDKIGAATNVYGVIGWPVEHSLSPAVHNAGFDAAGFDGVYLPLPIPPEYEHFKATLIAFLDFAGLDFRGASVTAPHKENLLRFVRERGHASDQIDPLVQRIGAANTLTVREDGSLSISNSDYDAALDSVCGGIGIGREDLAGMRVAVLGAGGVARAVVAGFVECGATVVVYNRTRARAEALAEAFKGLGGKVVAAPLEKLCNSCCQAYINCTPVGSHPNVDATPMAIAGENQIGLPPGAGAGAGTVVFDTIYNPIQTRLLREARAAGCVTISGVEMFVRQAAAQFSLWTGASAVEVFRRVLMERLGGSERGRRGDGERGREES